MIDVHCHLNFNAFKNDYDEAIKNAFAAGVTKIINVGTKLDTSQKAVELAEKYENLYAIVGVHPHHADKPLLRHSGHSVLNSWSKDLSRIDSGVVESDSIPQNDKLWIEQLEDLVRHPKVVAIGEIGMDYFRYQSNDIVDPRFQREIFIKQIELAHKLKKPLQIHNRHAGKDILEVLNAHKNLLQDSPGMFHCMSGNLDFLKKVLDMGFYIGFDGNITYEGLAPGEDTVLSELVKATPLDRLVMETDSPYLTPVPHRGTRNEPKNVIIVAKAIARIKSVTFKEVIAKTTDNAASMFQL